MNRNLRCTLAFVAVLSTLTLDSCGGGSPIMVRPQISVVVSASASSVEATATDPVTAIVTGDDSGKGVTWSVSCSASDCGSVAPGSGASGTFTSTYTAPSTPPPTDLTITVKAVSVADSSRSGSVTVTISAITVSVSPSTAVLQAGMGNSVILEPVVNNDPSNQGVTWSMSPKAGPGTLSVQNGNATYTAPGTPPATDATITITAASVEDPSKTAAATVTLASVTLSITPPSATVDADGTVPNIIATAGNDSGGKGVSWSVACSISMCGTVSPSSTADGAATTYSAPGTPPAQDLPITITAASLDDPAAQASMVVTVKAISVSVSAPNTTVLFGESEPNIVATVNDDPAHKGVTWSIQDCGVPDCGSVSPTATASGAAVTYSAPSKPPDKTMNVTLVATSVSDPNQAVGLSITIPAITVALSPASAIIPVGATAALNATPFTATVGNDSSSQGVTWTLTQNGVDCSTACGSIDPSTTGTGKPASYAAPAAVPTDASVTVTATSVADPTKAATATITVAPGTVKLIPASLDFGGLKINQRPPLFKTLTETLTNTGASTLNITDQSVSPSPGPFAITSLCNGNHATNVASGKSCDVSITFTPTALGKASANLSIADNDSSSPQQVALSGVGCQTFKNCTGTASFQSAIARNQIVSVPVPTGANKIGTQVVHFVDTERFDPYLANDTKRELMVRFWYPTSAIKECVPAAYTSAGVWTYLARLENVAPPQVKTNSCQDAPVANGKHPVVVFTHGYTGTFTDYTFLFEDLASRGYIVASVNHTYEATAVQFPDGRIAKTLVGSRFGNTLQLDDKATSFAVAARISDLKSVMDELRRMDGNPNNPFGGKFDMTRVAIAGHSLGGLTAMLGLEMEPRFRAAVSLDGITPGALFGTTSKPVLMLFAGRDASTQPTCHVWNQLQGPKLVLSFKGADHLTPSDAVWLAKGAVQTGTMGMEKTVEAIRAYVAAFLDTNLKGGSQQQLLKGSSSEYPDVQVTTAADSPCAPVLN
jgi:dienelactone hydrolase